MQLQISKMSSNVFPPSYWTFDRWCTPGFRGAAWPDGGVFTGAIDLLLYNDALINLPYRYHIYCSSSSNLHVFNSWPLAPKPSSKLFPFSGISPSVPTSRMSSDSDSSRPSCRSPFNVNPDTDKPHIQHPPVRP
eukprot:2753554-Pyramimonas_sp.AAC.1